MQIGQIQNYVWLTILLIALFIAVLLELFFAFTEKENLRKGFKVFPLLFLTIVGIYMAPNHPLLYIASFLGFLGDLLIIFEKKKVFFYIGGVSFFVGHILYLILMLTVNGISYSWYHYLIAGICLIALVIVFKIALKKQFNLLQSICAALYFGILFLLLVNSIVISIKYSVPSMLLITLGYVIFIMSDTILVIKDFIKEFKRDDFYVMSTYLFAQISIMIGFLMVITN